jgi:hypothetical protein
VKAGKRAAKFEDRMGGREECRILTEKTAKKKCPKNCSLFYYNFKPYQYE